MLKGEGWLLAPGGKALDAEKDLDLALHMKEKNMTGNYSPKQLLDELIFLVMQAGGLFLGHLHKAVRHVQPAVCSYGVMSYYPPYSAALKRLWPQRGGPHDTLTWLKRPSKECLGALQRVWINIGSYTMQSVKLNLEMMRLPGLLQHVMRLPALLNQCPDLYYLYIGRQRPNDKMKRLEMKQAFEERSQLSAAGMVWGNT